MLANGSWLAVFVLPLAQEPTAGGEDSATAADFAGRWATSGGPLDLRVVGGEQVAGHYTIYGFAGELRGEVQSGRLRHEYFGPGTDGEGWFELREDGDRLEGGWRPVGGQEWFPWYGHRSAALERLPALSVDTVIQGVIEDSDLPVYTFELYAQVLEAPIRGKTYRLEVPSTGPYFVELRSYDVDAFLVLRDGEGNVLALDEESSLLAHPRIAVPSLKLQERYLLEVGALWGTLGPFELVLHSGEPPELVGASLMQAALEDAELRLGHVESRYGPDHPNTARSLHLLGLVLGRQLGRVEEARPLFERALRIRENALGAEHLETGESLYAMAGILGEEGLYEEARPLAERALAVLEASLGPDSPTIAGVLQLLSSFLGQQGLLDEARPMLERALRICEAALGPEDPQTGFVLNGLAYYCQVQGELDRARVYAERANRIWARTSGHEYEASQGAHNLAAVLEAQGLLEEARIWFEQSIRLMKIAAGPSHYHTATGLRSLAGVLHAQAAFPEARQHFETALDITERTFGSEHPATAGILLDLATLLVDQGELEAAFEACQQGIASTEARSVQGLRGLTESERLRYAAEIRATLELYLSLVPLLPDKAGSEQDGYERLLFWKGRVSRSMLSGDGATSQEERALLARLRAAQARLSDAVYRLGAQPGSSRERELEELRNERNELELELVRKRASTAVAPVRDPDESVLAALCGRLPSRSAVVDFYVHRVYRPASPPPAATEGPPAQPGVWSSPRLTAWVLTPASAQVARIELGEASVVEAAARDYLSRLAATRARGVSLVSGSDDAAAGRVAAEARRLRELLWDPLEEAVGEAELVFVSPDGFLGMLPFETLPLEDGSYLVERCGFVYLADMASLPRRIEAVGGESEDGARRGDATGALLVAGDIDYGGRGALSEELRARTELRGVDGGLERRGLQWRPLPGTRDEAEAVAGLHERAFGAGSPRTVLTGRVAHEEAIKAAIPGSRYVHLATHGFFHPEGLPSLWASAQESLEGGVVEPRAEARITGLLPGLLSGLVLSGANAAPDPGRDNGLFTAEEVTYLDLARCELVVLSACETGTGRAESGEGILGLRRSFRQAGARTVVSSLWSVDDEATSALMQRFYARLWIGGEPKLEALRGAQLDMLEANRRENDGDGLPSTWGAFVLDGDWR